MTNPNQERVSNQEPSRAYFFTQIRKVDHRYLGLLLGRVERDLGADEKEQLRMEGERQKRLLIHAGHIAIAS